MTLRIFIEAKKTASVTPWAHAYLVMRDIPDGIDPNVVIAAENDLTTFARWIGGHPSNSDIAIDGLVGLGGPLATTENLFVGSKDWYSTGTARLSRPRLDITDEITQATGASANGAWAMLSAFANALNAQYRYSVPLASNTPAEIARYAEQVGGWSMIRPYVEAMTANA